MGYLDVQLIIKYNTPLGEYAVNENLEIFYNGTKIGQEATIPQVKALIARFVDKHRKEQISDLQNKISEINGMSANIETYKVTPQF